MNVGYIANRRAARELCDKLLQMPQMGLDTEGVCLGRFGRLCVLQIATPSQAFLCDALQDGVVDELKAAFESSDVVKIMHDCREDSAALFNQYGVNLRSVYDTQVAHRLLRPLETNLSFAYLIEQHLGDTEPEYCKEIKLQMGEGQLWRQRPLSENVVRYAIHGVYHLLPLYHALSSFQEASEESVLSRSEHHIEYAKLNLEVAEPKDAAKIGTQLWAMAAARKDEALFFKLNLGRTGVVSTPSALSRFADVDIGDTVRCVVSGVSKDGSFLYVDRYDHDWDFYQVSTRPKPAGTVDLGREVRHETSILESTKTDPLLTRVVGESYDEDSDDDEDDRRRRKW